MVETRAECLGLATELVCRAPRRANYTLSYITLRLLPAIVHEQIHFAFEQRGTPVALWIWAFLAPDVERRIMRDARSPLHESEWNEGGNLWVLDLIAPYGHMHDVIRFIRQDFFTGYKTLQSARKLSNGETRITLWRPLGPHKEGHRSALSRKAFASSRTEWFRQRNG